MWHPRGLPHVLSSGGNDISTTNSVLQQVFVLCRICARNRSPLISEAPRDSYLWMLQKINSLMKYKSVQLASFASERQQVVRQGENGICSFVLLGLTSFCLKVVFGATPSVFSLTICLTVLLRSVVVAFETVSLLLANSPPPPRPPPLRTSDVVCRRL